MDSLTFNTLKTASRSRCERWHPEGIESWSLSDWAVALAGEVGEACDVIKKLNRDRDGIKGNSATAKVLHRELAKELADVMIYLDLLAQAAGIDLEQAVIQKFNAVSERVGFPERLPVTSFQHPDDQAVDRFSIAMKAKLREKRDEGRRGWEDPSLCAASYLRELLRAHITKGDPVDVGNLAMMLWNRKERT